MDTLISDGGKYEISKRVTDLLRSLFIKDYQSEPYHQHQNKAAENRFGLAKTLHQYCHEHLWLSCLLLVAMFAVHLCCPQPFGIPNSSGHSAQSKLWKELLQTLVSFFTSLFMSLSTTGLTLLSLTSTFLHHPMKRRVIGLALLTTKVTLSPGESLLRTLKRSSLDLVLEVPSGPQQTSVLHHLQGRGPHFLFPIPYPQHSQLSLPLDPLDESNPTFEHFVNSQSGEDEDNPIPMTNIDIPNLLGRSFSSTT